MTRIEIGQISGIGRSLFVICLLAGAIVTAAIHHPAGIIAGAALGVYLLFAIKVVRQWEKVAVLRLGHYVGLRGPGLFHIVPIVETLSAYVDQRVRVASVSAESTLTRDTVPVNVDAIVFWLVWNAEKSILEVENFIEAINMSAQTALRESIGRHELAQMITERETMGRELQRILDEKTNPWGITVQSVEIRDVRFHKVSKTPCRGRRKPSVSVRRESFWARRKRKSPTALCRLRHPTRKTPWPCTCGR